MSDYKPIIISDEEVTDLLKASLLEKGPEDIFIQNLIDMNAKIVFATEPIVFPSIEKEQEFISKLQKNFVNVPNLKWLWGGISSVIVVGIALLVYAAPPPEPKKQVRLVASTPVSSPPEKTTTTILTETVEPLKKSGLILPVPAEAPETQAEHSFLHPAFFKDELSDETPPVYVAAQRIPELKENYLPVSKTDDGQKIINDTFSDVKRIEIYTAFCDVTIKTVNGDRVYAKGKLSCECKGLVVRKPEYAVVYQKKDSVLKVTIENKNKSSLLIAGNCSFENTLNFEVPQRTQVLIKNSSGDVRAEGLNGTASHIESTHGDITAYDLSGIIYLYSASGDIDVNNVNGRVRCDAYHGDVTFADLHGNLKLNSQSGNIKISNAVGNTTISCGHGNSDLNNLAGDLLLKSLSGNIRLRDHKGEIKVESGHGDIHIEDCSGNIFLTSTSGNIYGKNIDILQRLTIGSTHGDIHMKIKNKAENLKFQLVSRHGDLKINKEGLKIDGEGELKWGAGHIHIVTQTQSGNQLFD